MSFRQKQNLRIKTETLDALLLENDPARLDDKGLKAALRVLERQPRENTYETVENHACNFPQPRLARCDQRAIHGSRSDRSVISGSNSGQQLFRFLDGRREVRIGKQPDASARLE